MEKEKDRFKPIAHRWVGFAACGFTMLECQTCGIIVKTKDALDGKYPICPSPNPKGCNLYKFRSVCKGSEDVLGLKIKEIIARELDLAIGEIESEKSFKKLGADLLDMIDIADALNKTFKEEVDLVISNEEAEKMLKHKVENLIKYVKAKL